MPKQPGTTFDQAFERWTEARAEYEAASTDLFHHLTRQRSFMDKIGIGAEFDKMEIVREALDESKAPR